MPLILAGGSGINGIVLKNTGGGINAPFLTWESLGQKFSIRGDNNYLHFGKGDGLGFLSFFQFQKMEMFLLKRIMLFKAVILILNIKKQVELF